jgi:hypothetical protein
MSALPMAPPMPPMAPPGPVGVPPPTMPADGDRMPGQGIRNLSEEVKAALLQLRRDFEGSVDGNRARREYVKKCLKLLEFYRGNHYTWWDYTAGSWRSTSSSTGGQLANTPAGTSQSLYPLNFFQGYMDSLIALIVGSKMQVRANPQDPDNPDDVLAAEKATLVVKAFQRAEKMFEQSRKEVFSLGICGTFGSYIRSVTDGERWGFLEEPTVTQQEVTIGEPHVVCPACGDQFNPAPIPGVPAQCEFCRAPLPELGTPGLTVPPSTVSLPQQGPPRQIPRARTVRTVVDGFELKLPFEAAEQAEFEMIVRAREVNKSLPRATWPEVADKIGGGGLDAGATAGLGTGDDYDRRARRQSSLGTTTENRTTVTDGRERVTLTEAWFRPRRFYAHDDPNMRKQLLELFPKGVKVVWAEDTFCEAREEEMDKVWRICHAKPGRSQVREPIMAAIVPVQEMANDIVNILRDVIEYTLPVTFVNQRVLDVRKWARSQVMAGATYSVTDTGEPVRDAFYQTAPGSPPEYASQLLTQLRGEIAEFLTGCFPAAFGGDMGAGTPAQSVEIQRQSALGRVNLYLQALQEHYADFAPLIVEDFKNNAIEPLSFVDRNEGGEMTLSTVSPDDLSVGRYRQQFEVIAEFPTTWAQKQALTLQMFQLPIMQNWVGLLKNQAKIQAAIGTDLVPPRLDAYRLEFRTIQRILQQEPAPGQPQPVLDPVMGQPIIGFDGQPVMQPGPPMCSIPTNPLDDHVTMLEACQDFWVSQDGQKAAEKAGPGWENFMLHVQERQAGANPPAPPPQPMAPPEQAAAA